eukprot:TRINITY_DN92545_c0_g1_i1.p1 TRINITY_DN92545_c0_g1~~TRINITY_DN92545_c0_g1_i1.p1  ORF type:complete len:201 (+),score=51.17 TRINITY_DN92545_c0_g1_i1:48-650(+)
MVSVLEGRWIVEAEGEAEDGFAMVSDSGAVSFLGDAGAEEMQLTAAAGAGDRSSTFVLLSGSGEELCKVFLKEEDGTPVLKLQGEDGSCETWRKADKVISRKKCGVQRVLTKEGMFVYREGEDSREGDKVDALKDLAQRTGALTALDVCKVKSILQTGPHCFSDGEVSAIFAAVDTAQAGKVTFSELVDFAFAKAADYTP